MSNGGFYFTARIIEDRDRQIEELLADIDLYKRKEDTGYLHLCSQVDKFCDFMKRVTARCGELLGGFYE